MIHTRKLKDGTIQFYNGSKKATIEETKQFIKANPSLIDKDSLKSTELRKYLGAVKGGKKRAANSFYDEAGKFITKSMQTKFIKELKELPKKGIDIDKMIELHGVKNITELFKKVPKLKKALAALMSDVGIHQWFNMNNVYNKLEDYTGKTILLNDEETDHLNAVYFIEEAWLLGKNYLGAMDAAVLFTYKGMNKLILTIPVEDDFINEDYEDQGFRIVFEGMEFYISTTKAENKKKSRLKKKKKSAAKTKK